jgi:hypothetical protein
MGVMLLWIASIMTAAIGVFWLPWHCASSIPVPGESYVFGFNNKVGILALGISIILGIAASYVGGRRTEGYQWLTVSPRFFPSWSEAKAEYRILIAACLLWSTWILFWGGYLVDPAWCESRGFYYGMDLLALGRVPYRDFMFNYGPATLYLPYWLSSLSGGGLSFEQAYPVILALFTSGGFVALFMILGRLELSKARRIVALILLLIGWAAFSMGLQYAPLRFVIVPATLILLDAVVSRQDGSIFWDLGKAGAFSVIAVLACFAISPEMGIAGGVAVAAYGFILLLRRSLSIWLGIACSLGALVAAAVVLRIFPDYLLSVFAFASGGSNFPIYPDLHNLTLVGLSLFIIPALIAPALSNPSEKRAPLAAALGVAGGMLLPAAFGRSDPGHVYYNGLTPIILMFPAAAALGSAWFRRWALWYVAMFVVALQFSYWSHYYGNYMNAIGMHGFYRQNPEMVNSWKAQWDQLKEKSPCGQKLHWSKVQPFPEDLLKFSEKGPMLLTSGSEGNYWLARFLILQGMMPPDYFHAYSQGATTPEQIEKRMSQSDSYEFLITPESVYGPLAGPINLDAYSQGVSAFLSKLLLFPVNSQAIRPPYFPDTEYSARMMDRFDPVAKFNGYLILQKKKDAPLSPAAR